MPLVSSTGEEVRRAPWRVAVASLLVIVASVLFIAFVAYCTRDGALAPPRRPKPDAGPPPIVDAGMPEPDAGHPEDEVPTVLPDVDAGPASVQEPALPPARVREILQPLLENCLKAALRFDPAIGGRARVTAELGALGNSVKLVDALSPVLATCVESQAKALRIDELPTAGTRFDVIVRFDGLRSTVTIDDVTPID